MLLKVDGTDPKLKEEYVLFSGHQDHDGVGPEVNGDPIWNGADDNASVVAMLAIGSVEVHNPLSDRLYLFGTDLRKGAYCSRYFVSHPTVELSSIAAVLNGDMIGRNAPDSAALLGATEPHLNSSDLVAITLAANVPNFKVDTSWDADHPENWYGRSDHLLCSS
jgi:Zn-dependent M28 family amino/carboxypeptidase